MYTLPIESKMEIFARTYSEDTGVSIELGPYFCTDGQKIFIPPISDQSDEWIRFMTEVGVYHETGHIVTKDAGVKGTLGKVKGHIFNVLRDIAIEKEMCKRYPGMARKWKNFLSEAVSRYTNKEIENPQVSVFNKILKILYLRGREKHLKADFGIVIPKGLEELFKARLEPLMDRIVNHSTVSESRDLTEEVFKALQTPEEEQQQDSQKSKGSKSPKNKDQNDSEDNSDGDSEEDEGSGKNSKSSGKDSNGSGKNSSEEDEGSGKDSKGSPEEEEDSKGTSEDEGSGKDSKGTSEDEGSKGTSEDEGSKGSGKDSKGSPEEEEDSGNTSNEDSEDEASGSLGQEAKELLKEVSKDIENGTAQAETIGDKIKTQIDDYVSTHKVYREAPGLKDNIRPVQASNMGFQQGYMSKGRELTGYAGAKLRTLLISERAPHWVSNCQTGRLDTKKLWKIRNGSSEVFRRRTEAVYEDAAVGMVIDNSGSMQEMESGVTKCEVVMSLANVLAMELDRLRVPFEVVNFQNMGGLIRNNEGVRDVRINIGILKSFEEPFRRVLERFDFPRPDNGTIELPAIVYEAKRLAMRKETKKVLFIMTDGGTSSGNSVLDATIRKAMKEFLERISRAGMKVVGIGIFDRELKGYCPDFMHVTDLQKFPSEFYAKLTKILL